MNLDHWTNPVNEKLLNQYDLKHVEMMIEPLVWREDQLSLKPLFNGLSSAIEEHTHKVHIFREYQQEHNLTHA